MSKTEKMTALLNFTLNRKSGDNLKRLHAKAEARSCELLGSDGELKPQYIRLLDSMKKSVQNGSGITSVVDVASQMMPDTEKPTAKDLYRRIMGSQA